jgi:hypothetical protein
MTHSHCIVLINYLFHSIFLTILYLINLCNLISGRLNTTLLRLWYYESMEVEDLTPRCCVCGTSQEDDSNYLNTKMRMLISKCGHRL